MTTIYRGFEINRNPHGGIWAKKIATYTVIVQDRDTEEEIKAEIDDYWIWEACRLQGLEAERAKAVSV